MYTKNLPHALKMVEVERARQALDKLQREADAIRDKCQHDWTDPVYSPERRAAYSCPGDPVGTMGVDWRGPTYVPAETIDRWTRTCKKCGYSQTTQHKQVKTSTHVVPSFPSP